METDSTLSAVCDHLAELGVFTTPTDIQRHAPPKIAPQVSDEELLRVTDRVSALCRKRKSRRESQESHQEISLCITKDSLKQLNKLKKGLNVKTRSEAIDFLIMKEAKAQKPEKKELEKQKKNYNSLKRSAEIAFKNILLELDRLLLERAASAASKFQYKSEEEKSEFAEYLFKKERKEILNKQTTARLMRIVQVN
ncbi:hypothetical protein YSKK_22690 [Halopseudomonas aestusnigri]|nr:hypothetical protein YSKK_22690 [Halopseudomonas aestusnigri]